MGMLGLCFIDNQNFTTFTDKIRKSQDFKWHQNLWEISETCNSAPGVGLDDITGFIAPVISDSLELSTLFIGQSQQWFCPISHFFGSWYSHSGKPMPINAKASSTL